MKGIGDLELDVQLVADHPELVVDQDDGQDPDEPADLDDDPLLPGAP